ncbi:Uncharacterised protein [Canicola haemoglobinophilus]|uniref:Uncharacterized protein n=1 Tax=Canicola haemoglobinophilus TaxID=733 RepID=A0A377I743_9PAST|nr:hypothetical protein [Canicola haemoglobinophilus]STO71003.1 Uncharacterised protein [Canicola haemoglobinophilus]
MRRKTFLKKSKVKLYRVSHNRALRIQRLKNVKHNNPHDTHYNLLSKRFVTNFELKIFLFLIMQTQLENIL